MNHKYQNKVGKHLINIIDKKILWIGTQLSIMLIEGRVNYIHPRWENHNPIIVLLDWVKKLEKHNRKIWKFYKLEPQVYIICALKSKRHEKQAEKRKIKYAKDKANKLTKQVKKAIKNDDLYSRVGSWDDQSPLNLAIIFNRYDLIELIELILKYAKKIDEVDKVLNHVHKDWSDYPEEHKPLDMANTDKMEAYLKEIGCK